MSHATFLHRQALYLRPDPARVIVRPFKPATEPRDLNPTDKTRANHIVERVLALDPKVAAGLLADVLENFQGRHRNLLETFEARADVMEQALAAHGAFSSVQRQLIGAYFLNEYSFEASALFNPSIVPHPDQSEAPKGGLRFILSLRAVGEGHVSSLTFRAGTIAADGSLTVDPTARLASSPRVKLRVPKPDGDEIELTFNPDEELSERVIFPVTDSQSNGIEDARFVEFSDDGRKTYYATYTAYSGKAIRSELIETSDFLSFRMSPLQGTAARNKGMALFPRRIDGKYAMIARQDNENLYLIYSDDLYRWDGGRAILKPQFPGNSCRSETAVHPSNSMKAGSCSRTASVRSGNIRSARPCSTRTIPPGCWRVRLNRCCIPSRLSAKATFPTWSIPAGRCGTTTRSFCPMPFLTPIPTLRPSRLQP